MRYPKSLTPSPTVAIMKFLSHHNSTTQALERWADEKDLVTADYYFWHSGTELQKSQEGLLRSLLHGVLSRCPELMLQVFPKQQKPRDIDHVKSNLWTRVELLSAFAALSLQTTLKKRFCFFIDGLDEYDGDHAGLSILYKVLCSQITLKFAYQAVRGTFLQELSARDLILQSVSRT